MAGSADALPQFNWDFQTYYPSAPAQPASLTSQQLASINLLDGYYPTTMTTPAGTGLTAAEMDEVNAMPAYFALSRDQATGVLSGRGIVVDDESSPAQPDLSKPASFNGDFVNKVERLTDLYARASTAQAPTLVQVYSDLIEHFLDQNYLPGGKNPPWMGNGYIWRDHGWKTLRMLNTLSADKRDLYALSVAYVCRFNELMSGGPVNQTATDYYYCYFQTAHQALALMSDTPAKWQMMQLIRNGLDISIVGTGEARPKEALVQLDGSIIHHDGYQQTYAAYSYGGMLQTHINWTTAGFSGPSTAAAIDRLRRGSLAWCFSTTGGLNPLHQKSETELRSASSPDDGGVGNGLDFAVRAARLKSAYTGTSIANDLEMAYAAIAKTGVGSTSLPVEWRGITPPSNIDPGSPLYTAALMGNYSHTTNGASILRGPGQWYASLRGQPANWRGGESRVAIGSPNQFNKKALIGSLMLITTGKNGRKPNEVDSGYFRDGWDYSYFPNVTCQDVPLSSLLPASRWSNMWSFFDGETNLTAGANLRDGGVWMGKFNDSCKSGFMLGNRIVLVGNNISGSNLHTGLIQTGHQAPASEPLVLDGASYTADGDWTLGAGGNHKIVDAQGNGYFIHAVADTPALRAHRGSQSTTYALSQNWTGAGTMPDFQTSTDFINNLNNLTPTTANFSKVWFDHGTSATNQALEYTVLVKPQAGELDAYATAMADPANAPVTIVRTSKIHRYRDRATGTDAAAVFDASENINRNSLLTVNRPGAYIWRRNNDLMQLSVSSADFSDTTPFAVTLAGNWTVDSSEDTYAVTATQSGGNTVVTLSYRESSPQRVTLRSQSATAWAELTQATDNNTPYTQFAVNLADAGIGNSPTYAITGGNASGLFAISGNQLVLTRAFTANDAGLQSVSVQVSEGGSLLGTIGVSVTLVNKAPLFTANPVVKSDALPGSAYSDSLAGNAVNASGVGGTLTFSKVFGPAWLNVATTGALSGTPGAGDVGLNTFTVRVTNTLGLTADATLQIAVESNGTLSNASGGSWSSPSNWGSGLVANGSDKTADFGTLNLTANATITLDGARTIGNLVFGDTTPSHDWTLATGTGGPLTLDVSTGSPTITVNNRTATLSVALAGTKGFTKAGTGALVLTGANTYTGLTTVGVNGSTNGGTLSFGGDQPLVGGLIINYGTVNFLAGSTVTVPSGASINTANAGGNNLRILNAAGVVSNAGTLNLWGGATFNLNAGANWTQSGAMVMKSNSTYTNAVLNVNAGAVFKYTGASAITLSASSGSNGGNGTLTIAGGSFEIGMGFVNTGGTAGSANLTLSGGGVLKLTADVATLVSNSGTTTPFNVQFGTGGGVIDTNGFDTTITQGIVNVSGQTGSLTKLGAGTLTLSGANTYTGTTTISEGTLAVSGSLTNGGVTVQNSATLGGSATIAGAVNVQAGGALAPSGTLTVNNTLALAGSAQMELSKTGSTLANDKVSGVSTVTYGGALTVTHLGPVSLAAGDSFQLFAATAYSGSFASLTLPTLAPNLVWDTSKLSVNGSIGVRARPVAVADAATTSEDTVSTITVLANDSDADGDALSIQSVTQGAHGTVAISGSNVTYTPAANWNGTDSFSYTITDNKEGTATATVTVTVASVNDAPVFTSSTINKPNATEDAAYSATLAGSATDVDTGDTLTYSKVSGPAWLSVAANGALSGTPANSDVGANSFTVKVIDAAGANDTATLNITVINVNDAPAFTANPISKPGATIGVAYTASLAGDATDVDAGDTLAFSKVSGPAWLSVASNGALSGTPPGGSSGANSFTVSVADAAGANATATLNITVAGSLPVGWSGQDIGSTGIPGGASESSGTYTVSGSGADIWNTADAFQFVSQTLAGDGEIRARVTSQTNTDPWAKAGVMIREGSSTGAVNALVAITPGNGFTFQSRATANGTSNQTSGAALNAAPNNWVRLTRSGTLLTAYVSADGLAWTQIGTVTISMNTTVSAGLAVTSHDNGALSSATFDNVSLTPFPAPWQTMDIGATGLLGSAEYFGSTYTVKGAGVIGGTSDKFRFVYQTLSGDGEIVARIKAPQDTGSGARLGVMIRDTLTTDSRFAFMGVDGGSNYYWQRRKDIGSGHSTTAGGSGTAPDLWVRVVRTGDMFRGYKSTDGVNWTIVNSLSITMGTNIYFGLAVSSGDTTTLNSTVMDNVTVVP